MDPSWLDYVDFAVTALVLVIGLIVANSYARHRRLKVAEDRIKPYGELWAKMAMARPSRGPLTPKCAEELAEHLRCWYHERGGGLLLPIPTLKMLLLILADLDELAKPDGGSPAEAEQLGTVSRDQISLLRSQLKIDLDIYDIDERAQLKHETMDTRREFLQRSCFDVERWGRPDRWYRAGSFHWHHYTGHHTGWRRFLRRRSQNIVAINQACPDLPSGEPTAQ